MTLNNSKEIADTLDIKKASFILHIPSKFEQNLNKGINVAVQILVDGRNSNVAATALGYANIIINDFNISRLEKEGINERKLIIHKRAWYNSNLETRWNITIGLLALLGIIQVMTLSGQSVAREREQGTFD